MTEAYFHEHASPEILGNLEQMIASATPPANFAPSAPAAPAKREHRGKEIANMNARNFASLMAQVPRGGRRG